jgi:hypothetical protein
MEIPTWALIAGGAGVLAVAIFSRKPAAEETGPQEYGLQAAEFDQRLEEQWDRWQSWANEQMGDTPIGPVEPPGSYQGVSTPEYFEPGSGAAPVIPELENVLTEQEFYTNRPSREGRLGLVA